MGGSWSILVLEDDEWIQELIRTVLESIYPSGSVIVFGQLERAEEYWREHQPALLIIDWNLPDGNGTQLVQKVRETDRDTPILMVTGRSDRNSVVKAARLGIEGFIAKPFDVADLRERLETILPPQTMASSASGQIPDLTEMLAQARDHGVRLTGGVDPVELAELLERADSLSVNELAKRWHNQAQLVAVLLNAANSASLRRTGESCSTLKEALQVLGVQIGLGHASALALDVRGGLRSPHLHQKAGELLERSEQLAGWASQLAAMVRGQSALCFTAGQLYCLGELATLIVCQRFVDAGGEMTEEFLAVTLEDWGATLGNRLKSDWRLPLPLRDLIGATHVLGSGHQSADRIVMRAAMLLAKRQWEAPELNKLLSRLGIEKETLVAGYLG